MKVRIGVSLGAAGAPGEFETAVGLLEAHGVDSLWLPENVYGPAVEPFTGMTFALAKTARLKAGSGISVPPGQRGAVFDEALTLLRLMLTSETVTFEGVFYSVAGASVGSLPTKPLDIWLGGSAPAGLRRIGRLADGWLGSFLTPPEAARAVATINAAADEAGRTVDQDHFGTSLAIAFDGIARLQWE